MVNLVGKKIYGVGMKKIIIILFISFSLNQTINIKYPNPFNPVTNISFDIPINSYVKIQIFDIQGRLINSLINNDYYKTGSYNISWDGTNNMGTQVPSGMYIYKLIGQNHSHIRKMVLMK